VVLDIPDRAQILILVGDGHLASPSGGITPPIMPAPSSRGRPLLKTFGVAVLVAVAFLAGQRTGPGRLRLAPADGAAAARTTAPEQYPLPDPPLPGDPASSAAADQIPPAFAQQLQRQPVVTPPPGAPTAAPASVPHPFGLED
jgi:hypothetical protein